MLHWLFFLSPVRPWLEKCFCSRKNRIHFNKEKSINYCLCIPDESFGLSNFH
uniref:Uncharacterized protein n=1 Tax=Rhizophora mucronata TaxID=61149 RepID=A0A2P2P2I8_RHIMU